MSRNEKILLIAAVLILLFTGAKADAFCVPGFCLDFPLDSLSIFNPSNFMLAQSACEDEDCVHRCSPNGASQCYDVKSMQFCTDYDGDGWREWGGFLPCTGDTSCGGGTCLDTQRPNWECSSGACSYNCVGDTSCGYVVPLSCIDECSVVSAQQCTDNMHIQQCGIYWDFDPCLEWGPIGSCIINTVCGYGTCLNNQRPSWYCSGNECLYGCIDDITCSVPGYVKNKIKRCYDDNLYWFDSKDEIQDMDKDCVSGCDEDNAVCLEDWISSVKYCEIGDHCGDNECNCQEDSYTCSKDCLASELVISIFAKEPDSEEWKETINALPQESIDILIIIINNSSEDLDNVMVKANLPEQVAYKQGLRIKNVSYGGDIREPFNIGFMSSDVEKRITFKTEIGLVKEGDILDIIGNVQTGEDVTRSDSVRVIIKEITEPSFFERLINKLYTWILLIFK